ncbi:MAG: TonB-dependent receptor plug domain-containing protein [Gemmatimonadaceae bacterium]
MQQRSVFSSLLFLCGLLALRPVDMHGQAGTVVSGQVTGANGGPLLGASVFVPALNAGATTNAAGRYQFTLPATASGQLVLSVRRIGYRSTTATITVGTGPIVRDFTLELNPTELSEVVVTALGVERERSKLGTAQQQLSAGDVNNTRAQNLVQQIQGKVSGVQITSPGTQGGSTNIIIRGQNSITGNNQPLFIIDGVAVSNANRGGAPFVGSNTSFDYGNALSDINPDDIESLSVLKGPNAAAIYGSRAANGVILIRTRRGGDTGGRMRTEMNSNVTFESPAILPDFQDLYGQGAEGEFEWFDGNYGGVNDGVDESWGSTNGRPPHLSVRQSRCRHQQLHAHALDCPSRQRQGFLQDGDDDCDNAGSKRWN